MGAFIKRREVIICLVLFFLTGILGFNYFMRYALNKTVGDAELSDQEKVTIHFVHWSEFPKQIFTDFSKKYPNILVEFEQYGIQLYPQVQMARIASGENIDLMGILENDYKKFISKGYLVDLTNESFLKNYEPDAVDSIAQMDAGHHIYGVAYRKWVLGIWYNKILFNKYYLKPPKDYNDFINICSILKTNGVGPLVLGCKDKTVGSYIFYLRLYNGLRKDGFKKINAGEIKWTDRNIVGALKDIEDFLKSGFLLKESMNLTEQQAFYKFMNGQAAMCLMSDWSLDMIDPGVDKVCDLGVFPIPNNDNFEAQLIPGTKNGLLFGAFAGSRNKTEAKLLLDYLSQTETAQYYSDATKSKTTVKGVAYDKLKYNELWEPLRKAELIAPVTVTIDNNVQKIFNQNIRELLMGVKSPDRICEELQIAQNEANVKAVKNPKKN